MEPTAYDFLEEMIMERINQILQWRSERDKDIL